MRVAGGRVASDDSVVLDALLARVGRRLAVKRSLARAGHAFAWLAAVLAAYRLGRAWFASDPEALAPWFAAAASAVLFGHAVLAVRAWPSRTEIAATVDRRARLKDRVVSALEVMNAEDAPHGWRDLILRDAARHVSGLRPAAIDRGPRPRDIILPAAVLLAVAFVPIPRGADSPAPVEAPPSVGADQDVDARLEELEELLRGDADREASPYISAVHREVEELRERLESGEVTPGDATSELDRLLGHVAAAYQRAGLPNPATTVEGAAAAEARSAAVPEPGSQFVAPEDAHLQRASRDDASEPAPPDQGRQGDTAPPSSVATAEESDGAASSERASSDDAAGGAPAADVTAEGAADAPPSGAAERDAEGAPDDLAGQSIGAARRSDRGPGERAGQGSQPLGNADEALVSERARDDVRLPETDRAEGRRIDVDVAPAADVREAGAPDDGSTTTEDLREAVLSRERIDAHADPVRTFYVLDHDDPTP